MNATGRNRIVVKNAGNKDIRRVLENCINKSTEQTKSLAEKLCGETDIQTCYNIWKFLKTRIKYKEDAVEFQDIRLPQRLIKDGVGDCKSFALFTAGILNNCGIDGYLTYTSYNNIPVPSHVYVTTKSGIIIDAVWTTFNGERVPIFKQHKRI